MNKKFLVIYETEWSELFKTYVYAETQEDAVKDFKDNHAKYGFKVIAARELTLDNIYL
jgi:hypothetical protein